MQGFFLIIFNALFKGWIDSPLFASHSSLTLKGFFKTSSYYQSLMILDSTRRKGVCIMKGFWWILFLVAVATAAFIYLTRPPKIVEKSLEESQTDGRLIARYWLDQAKKDQIQNMKSACIGSAKNQSDTILAEIHKAETSHGFEFADYTLFSLGGGGALRAVLIGPEGSGVLLQLNLSMREENGKWWVFQITTD